jgi:enamine deaminase RidA (YjgF/YER057c/UK114 family)
LPPVADSPAMRAGNLVFVSGQLASDDRTGIAAEARIDPAFPYYGSSIKRQTRYVLERLAEKFRAAGTSLDQVVKAHVFHTDLRNFDAFDEAWREFFPNRPPCRATWASAACWCRDAWCRST